MKKHKVSISMTPERKQALQAEAKRQGISMSDLVHDFIDEYVAQHGTPDMLARLNRDIEHVSINNKA